jgi:hypothetical protein
VLFAIEAWSRRVHILGITNAHQYVLDSVWGDVQPSADDENDFLASHSWDDYPEWYLGLTDSATDDTKSRYAFGYGDFPSRPSKRPACLSVPSCRVATQGDRARRPYAPAASRRHPGLNHGMVGRS